MNPSDALRAAILQIAALEVGTREAGGNNNGARIRLYQTATSLDPGSWPWCAAFAAWVLRGALNTPAGFAYAHERGVDAVGFRCRSAQALTWLVWAEKHDLHIFDENSAEPPLPGDFVVYDFSHIGIVEQAQLTDGRCTRIQVIEGNTAPKATQRDGAGSADGVWRMTRPVSLVKGYIRL